jgi:eukaryotic translation initiation factor 2C
MILIRSLQRQEQAIFTPKAVYDGRKNMFTTKKLFDADSREFDTTMNGTQSASATASSRPPKVYKVKLTKVAEINPEVLQRFVEGKQSHDNTVLTAITALNVVIRMEPTQKFPFNVRSFFPLTEKKDIGSGITLCRGYFQSVRPGIGRMLINIDISTATMYKEGPLLDLCLQFLNKNHPRFLSVRAGFPDRERLRLQRFLTNLRINTERTDPTTRKAESIPRVIKKLSSAGANDLSFQDREGRTKTVAQFFHETQNRPLQFPDVICVEVGTGALIPLERCTVTAGQIMRKQVPPEKTKDVLDFATKKPQERLASITAGLGVLAYGQSEYVRSFGMQVDTSGPVKVQARVLKPPVLKYGDTSKQPTITPRDGAWNMVDKRFFRPVTIEHWIIVIYERRERFGDGAVNDLIKGLLDSCRSCGMVVVNNNPMVKYEVGHGNVDAQLKAFGQEYSQRNNRKFPSLIVAVLPEGGNDIYTAVKHFGDITTGTATQCLKSNKCFRAKSQYYANVCLKINVKLGGINAIPDPQSVSILSDPNNPTLVMGADVAHPAPGSIGRPSYTGLVANLDSNSAKYVATTTVQTSRQEMIDKLEEMSVELLRMYMNYRIQAEKKSQAAAPPKRIIFYRDGVSEGQFQQVLDIELPRLKAACTQLGIKPNITIIVVGKRHHVRFFPQSPNEADRSGNCVAGTVVDREVGHPTEFDFYLQSHGGLLGTSRPAHYSVLYDENNFSPDALQSLSFALCHVYARSTRSVSIPAPVYYADIVCDRAKIHYSPASNMEFSNIDTDTNIGSEAAESALNRFSAEFKPVHQNTARVMYFS